MMPIPELQRTASSAAYLLPSYQVPENMEPTKERIISKIDIDKDIV